MDINLFKLRNIFYNSIKLNSLNQSDDCINEWEFYNFKISLFNNYCICGQPIKKIFTIKNINNNNKLIIGKDCIKKFMIDNIILQEQINKIEKAYKYIKNNDNNIFNSGKYNKNNFLNVYNIDKSYVKFILSLEYFKNPQMRNFKNYINYKKLIEI